MGAISSKADTYQGKKNREKCETWTLFKKPIINLNSAIESSEDPVKQFCFEKCKNKTVNAFVAEYPGNHRIYNCLCKDLESEARKWAIAFGWESTN